MSSTDPSMHDLHLALSAPAPNDPTTVTRRRFLQAAAAGVGVSMLPTWLADAAAAGTGPAAGSSGTGTLVLVVLDGGNDGLHMVPPVELGAYHDARGNLAWSAADVHDLGNGRGLHPALSKLKARFDLGDVAIIDGVGNPQRDLSHFSSMADHHRGGSYESFGRTGWVGRYLDETAAGPYDAIAFGDRVPLLTTGQTRSAITLPRWHDRLPVVREWAGPLDDAIGDWSEIPTGRGDLADSIAAATSSMFDTAAVLRPWYPTSSTGSNLVDELTLCARLANASLGTRVLTVRHGPYDAHTGLADMHGERMTELDAAIEAFFANLDDAVADDVTLLCVSEFGRRVASNGGGGTDHGAGSVAVAVGRPVVGGFHGELPSLTSLTPDGNLTHDIDYRSIIATVVDRTLGADSASILGGTFPHVPFLGAPAPDPDPDPDPEPEPRDDAVAHIPVILGGATRIVDRGEADVLRLVRAFLAREPDPATADRALAAHASGARLSTIAGSLAESPEFQDRYGSLSDEDFVRSLHESLIGRAPTDDERRELVDRLGSGDLDRADVVVILSGSAEYRRRFQYTAKPGWSTASGARDVGVLARSSG